MDTSKPTPPGRLRRLDPRRDLDAVANLVEDAFGLRGDPDGQFILDQMRQNAARQRQEPFLSNLAYPSTEGFVWEVDGKVVGNINLIPFRSGLRPVCLVANVAVAEEFRNRGIATALTRHALRVARQQQAVEIWLQVRHENQVAIHMYESLGFRRVRAISQYRHAGGIPRSSSSLVSYPAPFQVGERVKTEWPAQKAALKEAYPPETRWYQNVDFRAFSPYAWFNPFNWGSPQRLKHLSLRSAAGWMGTLTWQGTETRADNLWLALASEAVQPDALVRLLNTFLTRVWNGRPLNLEYPMGQFREAIIAAGFDLARDLDWMRCQSAQRWPLERLQKSETAR